MINTKFQTSRFHDFALVIEALLRGKVVESRSRGLTASIVCIVACGMFYGAMMGTFGGIRPAQVVFSAVKVPLLLLAAGALSLPSVFVLYSLWGLRDDFGEVVRGLIATQAAHAAVLASFAPFTVLWYVSSTSYPAAVLVNCVVFIAASISTQGLLLRHCRALIKRDARHRLLLWFWLALYAFIGIQMGWMLRPFVGDPMRATTFFRPDSLSNAYEGILRLLL